MGVQEGFVGEGGIDVLMLIPLGKQHSSAFLTSAIVALGLACVSGQAIPLGRALIPLQLPLDLYGSIWTLLAFSFKHRFVSRFTCVRARSRVSPHELI